MFIGPPFKGGNMFHRLARTHVSTGTLMRKWPADLEIYKVDGHVTYCGLISLLLICHPNQYFLYKLTTSSSIFMCLESLA